MVTKKSAQKHIYKFDIYKNLTTLLKAHFMMLGFYIAQLILFDASKLITPDSTKQRWLVVSLCAIVFAGALYILPLNKHRVNVQKIIIPIVAITDILFAAFNVYITRGMASKAVFIFIFALATVSLLRSLPALLFCATVAAALYISTAVSYFVNNFNEGYKVELYGEVGFYASLIYASAYLFWAVSRCKE